MKQTNTILAIILLVVLAGCGENKQSTDDLITVDVSKSYPKKELILQDFMDVEYIALETTDEFLTQGLVKDVGKKCLLVTNRNNDGDIFIFDRKTGKGVRKINRQGPGAEEYTRINEIILDESNDEIFVKSPGNKILVYDLYGKFKRCLNLDWEVSSVFDYDKNNLICYDMSDYHNQGKDRSTAYHVILSKQDGSITQEIKIPFKEKKFLSQIRKTGENNGRAVIGVGPGHYYSIFPFNDNWLLSELSSDTVYTFMPDYNLRPFIVRTPSIQSMNPEECLILRLFSDRYYFMESIKNVYDWNAQEGFPSKYFVYDTKELSFSGYTIYNGDFLAKKEIYMSMIKPINHEITSWNSLEAYQLVESYNKGELKGKLKEIASKLDEDSNPVIMLIKHKNRSL